MKKLLLLTIISLCMLACKKTTTNDSETNKNQLAINLNDSVNVLVSNFILSKDSSLLEKAIVLSDSILKTNTDIETQRLAYDAKSNILSMQGKRKEAFIMKGKSLVNDPTNIEWLTYLATDKKLKNQTDSAKYYFALAENLCDKKLIANPKDIETMINKISIYTFQNEKQKAKEFLDNVIKQNPDQKVFVNIRDNIDDIIAQSQLFFKEEQ